MGVNDLSDANANHFKMTIRCEQVVDVKAYWMQTLLHGCKLIIGSELLLHSSSETRWVCMPNCVDFVWFLKDEDSTFYFIFNNDLI